MKPSSDETAQVAVPTGAEPRAERISTPGEPPVRVLPWRGTDAELLRRMHSDPHAGAALFYDRFSGLVNGLVWRLLGADCDHEDIVQDLFIKLLTKVGTVREGEGLAGWVQTVVVHFVRSELRKRRVRRLFAAREEAGPSPVVDSTRQVEERDLLRRLGRELDSMATDERMVFALRYIEEKPLLEVAELCGCSLATAKRRLQKANKRFAAFCARYPDFEARLRACRGGFDGT